MAADDAPQTSGTSTGAGIGTMSTVTGGAGAGNTTGANEAGSTTLTTPTTVTTTSSTGPPAQSTTTPAPSSPESFEVDTDLLEDETNPSAAGTANWQEQTDPESSTAPATAAPRPPPLQKRRRVTRACDECRRKKIKCDGKQPCTHCTVYSYGMRLFPLVVVKAQALLMKHDR